MLMWILDSLWWNIGYAIARLTLRIVTFGKVRAEPIGCCGDGFGWLGCRRHKSGGLEVQSTLVPGLRAE